MTEEERRAAYERIASRRRRAVLSALAGSDLPQCALRVVARCAYRDFTPDDWRALFRLVASDAAGLGVEVAFVPLPERVLGRSLGGRVEIQPSIRGRERAAVLAHELAHEVLHQAERRRAAEARRPGPQRTHAECETEADATAYVVLRVLGIPSRAPAYIAWQGGTGAGVLR